jgi:hypothetical protein
MGNRDGTTTAAAAADLVITIRPSVARVASVTRYIDIDNEPLFFLHTAIIAITRKRRKMEKK